MKEMRSVDELLDMYNTCNPSQFTKSFRELPEHVQCEYHEMYNVVGFGECQDCGWFHEPEGCNVQRDSNICKMNKRLRSHEWLDRITAPRTPVMKKYNICAHIIEQKDKGKYHGPFAGPTSLKNYSPWDFGPSEYVKETFKNYIGYYYINFVEFVGNNSQELYDQLIDDSADKDMTAFEAIRKIFGINSGVLIMHFPLLIDKEPEGSEVVVSGKTPIKPYLAYAKENGEWREGFFSMIKLKEYLNKYISDKEGFKPTPTIHLNEDRVIKNENGAIIGIKGKCNMGDYMENEKVSGVMISITKKDSPYVIAKDVFMLESAVSMLRGVRDRRIADAVKEVRQMLEMIIIEIEKASDDAYNSGEE